MTPKDRGSLSPRLRNVIERLLAARAAIAEEAVEAFQREIPVYRTITDEALWNEVRGNVEENAQLWYESLLTGTVPSENHLQNVAAFARHRVHQGVPLPELLQAFRIGSSIIWSAVLAEVRLEPAIQEEVLFELSPRYFDFIETVSRTTTEAYTAELGSRLRWRDRIKHELVELVFSAQPDEVEFRQRAAALGMDPLALHAAVAIRVAEPRLASEDWPSRSWRPLDDLRGHLPGAGEATVEMVRDGAVLLWVATPAAGTEAWERNVLMSAARKVASGDASVERIGIGSPARGAEGWRVAAEQALRALELGPQVQREEKLHRYADLAIYDVARRTPQIAQFLQTCLDRLPADADILDSIGSWFDHGRHLKSAAAALRVHPNTLSYRLKRAEEILGGTFDDPEWSLRLQLALKLRQCE